MRPGQTAYLLYQATRCAFLAREKNSLLGVLWHLLHPLAVTAVLCAVFWPAGGAGGPARYPLYVLAGVVQFNFFANATTRAVHGLQGARALVLNSTVPREVLVLRAVGVEAVTFAAEAALVLALAAAFVGPPGPAAVASFLWVTASLALLTAGVALPLAAAAVFAGDLVHVWAISTRLLFFLTPVFYAAESVAHPVGRAAVGLNPLTHLLGYARAALLRGSPLGPAEAALLGGGALAAALAGWTAFRRLSPHIPDYI